VALADREPLTLSSAEAFKHAAALHSEGKFADAELV
jgi:hypothetical protein